MLLQVHDELVFDLLPAEEQKLKDILSKEMVNAIKLSCPIDIEIGVGLNWLEAH